MKKYVYTDYTKIYGRIMQFNKNKQEPIHRWYPFVEGYSKEFIQSLKQPCVDFKKAITIAGNKMLFI